MLKKKTIFIFLLSLIFILSSSFVAAEFMEHCGDHVVRVYDEDGNYIFATARGVVRGDRYISTDNIEYVIEEASDDRATAVKKGEIDLLQGITELRVPYHYSQDEERVVAIYHTHNGESYEPSEAAVEGPGDIHEVGRELASALENLGVRVVHNENLHLPHDGASYERSRATAMEVSEEMPHVVLDLHRDGIPDPGEYLTEIDGETISQVRLVIGRQNPNSSVNDQFARQLKAAADEIYPGLVRDIFFGRGNYNQSISPNSVLLEFGTHTTTKEQAIASAHLLAEPLINILYGEEASAQRGRSAYASIPWIIGLLVVGILIFLFINEGSWEGVVNRLKNFIPNEMGKKKD
ncbi:stage II sporulation protein P [Natronospora cellulosivora (SeqCode)]